MNEWMNDLFAKHRHSTEIIKTVWQEQKGSGSCSYIRHKKKKKKSEHISTQTQINNEKWNRHAHTQNCSPTNKNSYDELTADKLWET